MKYEVAMTVLDRQTFEKAYLHTPPWEIGEPQKELIANEAIISGDILDVGCGTGENALYLAERGHRVLGIDFMPAAIEQARIKAARRGLSVSFEVMDALTIGQLGRSFDTVIDSGVFHVFSDADRRKYVEQLASVLRPGGKVIAIFFSDLEPGTHGPRRVSEQEVRTAFLEPWVIEKLQPARYRLRTDHPTLSFSPGGAKSWLVVARWPGSG